jgi:hypothetical protein
LSATRRAACGGFQCLSERGAGVVELRQAEPARLVERLSDLPVGSAERFDQAQCLGSLAGQDSAHVQRRSAWPALVKPFPLARLVQRREGALRVVGIALGVLDRETPEHLLVLGITPHGRAAPQEVLQLADADSARVRHQLVVRVQVARVDETLQGFSDVGQSSSTAQTHSSHSVSE